MRYPWLLLMLSCAFVPAQAQMPTDTAFFWVSFADKAGTPYTIEQSDEFLSPRAIARRQRFGIPITEADLPVSAAYSARLSQEVLRVHYSSRWLNGAAVLALPEQVAALKALPFIKELRYIGPNNRKRAPQKAKAFDRTIVPEKMNPNSIYGPSEWQFTALKADSLHALGYTGQGILIAVLDGGFTGVDQMGFFDSLRTDGRLNIFRDFVDGDDMVFEDSGHGTSVLSVMGANVPGLLVGTAPGASYACIKTEDVRNEHRMEEYNWVAGLEFADSLGAEVVNSSLGYTTFSDSTMDYTYNDLNGQTSPASIAADFAHERGMIVVTSAGNEGDGSWRYVGTPADSKSVLAVGATTRSGQKASFSSFGPTPDGRMKPDVSAPGSRVGVASMSRYSLGASSGTSLASPLLAGMVASLWQAFPERSHLDIIAAIKQSGSQADKPDNELGYGIPDFMKAYRILKEQRP